MLLDRIVIDLGVLPTVADVGFVGVEDGYAPVKDDGESLRRFAIVLVNLRQAVGEIVTAVVNRVRKR